ncbi:glutamate/tyrosine decarboxylase-like PLP-dependent enzyme [Marmoricola bigeumensis]|uniref:Glutamate/tyrosine decarboxylase-like PLP-dependent enzyme n=2 Tax=Nocardioides marmoribigeumensis TaxID=433649 RepID=A0ABU2BYQ4_9ACTN|nr:glutamate/tyrosine decarboxylase-like PLP-dependent enzyme [Nocardioides marmoribigeumensis]
MSMTDTGAYDELPRPEGTRERRRKPHERVAGRAMHRVDQTTEQMVRSVLAYAENRLRMDPVPLDQGTLTNAQLYERLEGVICEQASTPDEVLGVYASVIAPSVISADSPRFLGFIPAAPTKASLLFDMLVSCASIQGISWLEASGAIAAENTVLSLIAGEAGLDPRTAGGTFVSGGSAGNLSALAVAREEAKRRDPSVGRWRVVVGTDAHSSVVNTLRLLEMDALVVETPDHRLTRADIERGTAGQDLSDVAAVVCTSGTTNAGIIDDLDSVGALAQERGWWFHVDGAYGGAGIFAPSLRAKYAGLERADSFILDPHKWMFTPFDCCALLYADPAKARRTHTQDASYLDVIHEHEAWNPTDYAYHLTRRARGLPLWFSLAVHGVGAYRDAIEVAVRLAAETAAMIRAEDHLELVREPDLGIVLFRRLGWEEEDYHAWARELHQDEVAFIPPSAWEGETVGRFAFLHPDTSLDLVREVLDRTR